MFISPTKSRYNKFRNDLQWNILSFVITAACGLLINILITKYFGFGALGNFNILLVFFIVLSQISSWGIHLSVQKFIPQFRKNNLLCKQLLTSSLLISIGFSLMLLIVLILIKDLPGWLMSNNNLKNGFIFIIPGIFFLTINKIFLSFLNGMRLMKIYAFFSAVRPCLMLLFLLGFIAQDINEIYLGLIFTASEIILSSMLAIRLKYWLVKLSLSKFKRLFKLQFWYGNRIVLGSVLTNFHSKLDIFILGFFVTNTMLGVYSFVIFIADGFLQIFYVFRTNINPIITDLYYNKPHIFLKEFILKNLQNFYKYFIVFGSIIGILYPIILYLFQIEDYRTLNLALFYILLSGILIASGYIPFQFIFNQIGKPKVQSNYLFILFLVSIIFNVIFISFFGIFGAAITIFLVNILQMLFIKNFIEKKLF